MHSTMRANVRMVSAITSPKFIAALVSHAERLCMSIFSAEMRRCRNHEEVVLSAGKGLANSYTQ